MVEADSHLKLLPVSILDIYKVFEHINMLSIGMQQQPYTVLPTLLVSDVGVLHHADKACAAQSHRSDTNLTQPQLQLILHLTRGIASLIKAQPLLKLNSTICRSCIFNFLPGLSHHLKRQPSVAPGGHAVCISYGILKDYYVCSPLS